jgi:4-hydroxy-2-oxoheptanedioate aldolase
MSGPTGGAVRARPTLRTRLRRDAPLVASFVEIPHRAVTQVMGAIGYDVLIPDGEHAALSPRDIEEMIVGGELAGVPSLVRVPATAPSTIGHALDSGAAGVLVPFVNTAEAAENVVQAARFPPEGRRGAGPSRSTLYTLEREEALANARAETVVAVQIETADAVEHLDAILAVEGVDLLFVGPNDLSMSLGRPPDAELRKIIDDVLGRAGAAGRLTGILAPTAELAARYRAAGCALLVTGTDVACLAAGGRAFLAATR